MYMSSTSNTNSTCHFVFDTLAALLVFVYKLDFINITYQFRVFINLSLNNTTLENKQYTSYKTV